MSQKKTILDYSQGYRCRGSIWDKYSFGNEVVRSLWDRFRLTMLCPYCHRPTTRALSIWRQVDEEFPNSQNVGVNVCPNCGWWSYKRMNFEEPGWSHEIRSMGILRTFDASDHRLPLETLRIELARRPGILYDIHSTKFESLVASIVGDFFDTEVTVVGRTNDGGVDLIYLDADKPVAIQVKRRERPEKAEEVALVREFLGAMLLQGFTKGKIVTTAGRFSKGSYSARDRALSLGLLEQFELIDVTRFLGMFRFNQSNCSKHPWSSIVDSAIQEWKDIPEANIRVWRP